MKTLVTGGVRSGKSTFAESLLPREATYVATGPRHDDPAWQARLDAHRQRRPASWRTVETLDVPAVLSQSTGHLLLDDAGNWLSGTLDSLDAWNRDDWHVDYARQADHLVDAVATYADDLLIVTNEVGFGLVSPYASGRVFTDKLGRLNQRLAATCDRVILVVSGCPLAIKGNLP